jgi:hypothetical protein
MKSCLIAAAVFLAAVSARAAITFAGIPWNTPAQTVVRKLTAAGFTVAKKPDHGDYRFRGKLLNHDAAGVAIMSDGKVVRVFVMLAAPDDAARETYEELRKVLIAKYGAPAKTVRSFEEPFHEGDGYEAEAIRSGKANFATQWIDGGDALVLNIASGKSLALTYDSAAQ